MVPPVTLKLVPPAVAVCVTPTQLPPTVSGVVLTTPAGYVSVKLMPDNAAAFGLLRVKVSTDAPLTLMVAGENAFAMPGF